MPMLQLNWLALPAAAGTDKGAAIHQSLTVGLESVPEPTRSGAEPIEAEPCQMIAPLKYGVM